MYMYINLICGLGLSSQERLGNIACTCVVPVYTVRVCAGVRAEGAECPGSEEKGSPQRGN